MSSPNEHKLAPPSFAGLVPASFAEHLTQQRALRTRTVAAYRKVVLAVPRRRADAARVDISVTALWLCHESPTGTYQYVEADIALKEEALSRL